MMKEIVKKSLILLAFAILICGVIYPLVLWSFGAIFFPFQAKGSLIINKQGKIVGSKLIAQAFNQDKYFQPRPSAANYDASASASSSLAASNEALRERIIKNIAGELAGPDLLNWFKENRFQGNNGIVAQWARLHPNLAVVWIKADSGHQKVFNDWLQKNPQFQTSKPQDQAIMFFWDFSQKNPGQFPLASDTDIQVNFFEMWLQDHPGVRLQTIPADMITTSASGLDPDITLENAEYQLNRVASRWAIILNRDPKEIHQEIHTLLLKNAHAPFAGLAGEKLVNVLEINLLLQQRYHS